MPRLLTGTVATLVHIRRTVVHRSLRSRRYSGICSAPLWTEPLIPERQLLLKTLMVLTGGRTGE